MARRKETPTLDFSRQLRSIPLHNEHVGTRPTEDGTGLRVDITLRHRPWQRALRILMPLREKRTYLLTGVGLELYRAVNGKRTVEELLDAFALEHKLTFFEARALVIHYLGDLMGRGLIVTTVPEDHESPHEG